MTKSNLWQVITGMVMTAICGIILNMGAFSFFPALIAAIIWSGYRQSSGKKYKNAEGEYVAAKFWGDFASVLSGAAVMWGIMMLG